MAALPRLVKQGRVRKEKPEGEKKFRYWFNEESEYKSGRGNQPASRSPLYQRVEFGEEKIRLLGRLRKIPGLNEEALTLIDSMMKDYGADN